jgi:transposase InsO family protein
MKNFKLLGLGAILFLEKEFDEFKEYCYRMIKMITETALKRVKILNFYKKYGLQATIDVFSVSRRTIYRWQKLLKESQGRLEALNPQSRKPHRLRQSKIHPEIIEKIRELRQNYPHLGPKKIKILLDQYCQEKGKSYLQTISHATISRLIKKYNFFFHKSIKQPHKQLKRFQTIKRLRKPNDFSIKKPGDLIEIDTIILYLNGLKIYILTAIDLKTRQAFAYAYKSLSSLIAKDFCFKLRKVFIGQEILAIKTDNGSEFLKHFHQYLKSQNIIHFFIYPRKPQHNAYIERFNGILQKEFINHHLSLAFQNLEEFNNKLLDYLFWYNTERPHYSLNFKSPLQYTIENFILQCHYLNNQKCHMYVGQTQT